MSRRFLIPPRTSSKSESYLVNDLFSPPIKNGSSVGPNTLLPSFILKVMSKRALVFLGRFNVLLLYRAINVYTDHVDVLVGVVLIA